MQGKVWADSCLHGQRKGQIMAFITTKSVIIASFIAAAGGGAGMAGHRVHRSEAPPAPVHMAGAADQATAVLDWSGQWYSVQRILHDDESVAGAIPSF
jgi:hypothetical protein